jgi:hypothetical protein
VNGGLWAAQEVWPEAVKLYKGVEPDNVYVNYSKDITFDMGAVKIERDYQLGSSRGKSVDGKTERRQDASDLTVCAFFLTKV